MSDLTKHHDPRVAAMYGRLRAKKPASASAPVATASAPRLPPIDASHQFAHLTWRAPKSASAIARAPSSAAPKATKTKAAVAAALSSFGHALNGDPVRAAEVAAAAADAAQAAALSATITDAFAIVFPAAKPRSAAAATRQPEATPKTRNLDPVLAEAIARVNSTRR
jgi:hypothetical protein